MLIPGELEVLAYRLVQQQVLVREQWVSIALRAGVLEGVRRTLVTRTRRATRRASASIEWKTSARICALTRSSVPLRSRVSRSAARHRSRDEGGGRESMPPAGRAPRAHRPSDPRTT